MSGAIQRTYTEASVEEVAWELNQPGTARFKIGALSAFSTEIAMLQEFQILRNGTLMHWGVVVNINDTITERTIEMSGVMWYFKRRFIGKANRTNHIGNPGFESGLSGWTQGGAGNGTGSFTPIATSHNIRLENNNSLRIVQTGFEADDPEQIFPIDEDLHAPNQYMFQWLFDRAPAFYTIKGWFFIHDGPTLVGSPPHNYRCKAWDQRGLHVEAWHNAPPGDDGPYASATFPINDDSPRNTWVRAEVAITLTGPADDLLVSLYAPQGTVYWDSTGVFLMESLSFPYGTDQRNIVHGIVTHAQDTVYGKSSLNIGVGGVATPIQREIAYQHADHENVFSLLQEFPGMANGMDIDVVITPTTRVFTTYYPRKGSTKTTYNLTTERVHGFTAHGDGERITTSIVALAEGDGPDREEGGWIDAASLGGLILEDIISVESDVLPYLTGFALNAVNSRKRPDQSYDFTTSDAAFPGTPSVVENFLVGDVCNISGAWGAHVLSSQACRCVRKVLSAGDDTVMLTMNREG